MATILLLEDNRDMLFALEEALAINGHSVIVGKNGMDGIHELESCTPDLIISDVNMPQMDGFDFLKRLRAHQRWQDIPVTIMSGKRDDEKIALSLGANAFMPKPFNFMELDRILGELL